MIELRTLGTLELRARDGPSFDGVLSQPKRTALLVYLALATPRGFQRRDTLLGLFWPDLDDERARRALRQSVYFLRHELGEDLLISRGAEELAVADEKLWCDAVVLKRSLESGRVDRAADLARGELLPGFLLSDAQGFERWLEEERARLRGLCAEAAWRAAELAELAGDGASALTHARKAAGFAAGDELAMRRLLSMMNRVGDRVAAVHAYDAFAARLAHEYELEPSPETVRLIEEIRAQRTSAPPAPTEPSLNELLGNSTSSAVGRSSRRHRQLTIPALITVALVFAAFFTPVRRALQSPADDDLRFVVQPFRAVGPDSTFWTGGVSSLLAVTLDGMAGLRPADPRRADRGAALVGLFDRYEKPRFRIAGTVIPSSTSVLIVAEVHDEAAGRRLGVARVQGPLADPFALINQLTQEIVRQTGLIEAAAEIPRVNLAALTTRSQPALAAWLIGERHFRRSDFVAAYREYTRAVEIDTAFALAHFRRWLASSFAAGVPYTSPYPFEAARFIDRLPPRDAAIVRALTDPVRPSAYEVFESLVDRYPDDPDLIYHLADRYYHERLQFQLTRAAARGAFERALQLDPSFLPAYFHLIEDAFAAEEQRRVRKLIRAARKVDSSAENLLAFEMAAALAWGHRRARADVIASLDTLTAQTLETIARALSYRGYADQLIPVANALNDDKRPPEARRYATRLLITAHTARGAVEQAAAVYQKAAFPRNAAVEMLRQHVIWRDAGLPVMQDLAPDGAHLVGQQAFPSERYLLASYALAEQLEDSVVAQLLWFERAARMAARNGNNPFFASAASANIGVRARLAFTAGRPDSAAAIIDELLNTPGYWAVTDWAIEMYVIDAARYHLAAGNARRAIEYLVPLQNMLVESPPVVWLRVQAELQAGNKTEARRHCQRLLTMQGNAPQLAALRSRAQGMMKQLN